MNSFPLLYDCSELNRNIGSSSTVAFIYRFNCFRRKKQFFDQIKVLCTRQVQKSSENWTTINHFAFCIGCVPNYLYNRYHTVFCRDVFLGTLVCIF